MHWGSNDNEGSEHVVDGKRYPAEVTNKIFFLEIIHINSTFSYIL